MILLLFQLFSYSISTYALHEFHISRTEIEYKSELQSIQISTHIFIDDFELALKELGFEELQLFTNKELSLSDSLIENYLNQQLIISDGKKTLPYRLIGKEMSEDLSAGWFYMQITDLDPMYNIYITNKILMSQFDDQRNIISIKKDSHKLANWMFDNDYSEDHVSLNE